MSHHECTGLDNIVLQLSQIHPQHSPPPPQKPVNLATQSVSSCSVIPAVGGWCCVVCVQPLVTPGVLEGVGQ